MSSIEKNGIFEAIATIILDARKRSYSAVNTLLIETPGILAEQFVRMNNKERKGPLTVNNI